MPTRLITNFKEELTFCLKGVKELWVAVALANDRGFDTLQGLLSDDVIQYYILGTDLPTSFSVLEQLNKRLKPGKLEAVLNRSKTGDFHPKVYFFRYDTHDALIIGSANLTNGALTKNTEAGVWSDEINLCDETLSWLKDLLAKSYPLSEENLESYRNWLEIQPSSGAPKPGPLLRHERKTNSDSKFDLINFSDRFFKKEHHLAFKEAAWHDDSPEANRARKKVLDRFTELHEQIFPDFNKYQLHGLFPNVKQHLVSMAYHYPDRKEQALNAMWLSYGKSEKEIAAYHRLFPSAGKYGKNEEDDLQSFINHARLQIRIELYSIGIWILFAKNNGGGLFDRDTFREQMKSPDYRSQIYTLMKKLPAPYWIKVNGEQKFIADIASANELHAFCKQDNKRHYFTIGRDYAIESSAVSETNLPNETFKEFQRLYPLYKKMRHYL